MFGRGPVGTSVPIVVDGKATIMKAMGGVPSSQATNGLSTRF